MISNSFSKDSESVQNNIAPSYVSLNVTNLVSVFDDRDWILKAEWGSDQIDRSSSSFIQGRHFGNIEGWIPISPTTESKHLDL